MLAQKAGKTDCLDAGLWEYFGSLLALPLWEAVDYTGVAGEGAQDQRYNVFHHRLSLQQGTMGISKEIL